MRSDIYSSFLVAWISTSSVLFAPALSLLFGITFNVFLMTTLHLMRFKRFPTYNVSSTTCSTHSIPFLQMFVLFFFFCYSLCHIFIAIFPLNSSVGNQFSRLWRGNPCFHSSSTSSMGTGGNWMTFDDVNFIYSHKV